MLMLGTDTSGKNGSIALARCEQDSDDLKEVVPLQGGTFSAQLVQQISELLFRHQLNKSEIEAFAVVSGPGSFTGLRVGLAAIKALAEILHKPIAAASLLEVIAFQVRRTTPPERIVTALDAGRNEAYVGEYSTSTDLPVCITESLLTFEELASRRHDFGPIYTPDDSVVQRLGWRKSSSMDLVPIDRPNAFSVAQLGYRKILAGQSVSPEALDATYIRRADAEIKKPPQAMK